LIFKWTYAPLGAIRTNDDDDDDDDDERMPWMIVTVTYKYTT